MGRLIRSSEFDGENNLIQRIEQLYDKANRLKKQSWVIDGDSFSESYAYNDPVVGADAPVRPKDGSLAFVTTATGDTIEFSYDSLKRLNETNIKNSAGNTIYRTGYIYKAGTEANQTTAQIRGFTVWNPDYTNIVSTRYEYDALGNITRIEDGTGTARTLAEYTYDELNQLIQEKIYNYADDSANYTSIDTYVYTYDSAGNILKEEKNGTVVNAYTYSTGPWADQLVAVNGEEITYDGSGNPEMYYSANGIDYDFCWTEGRQLAWLQGWGEVPFRANYEYDADGIRVAKSTETITGIYSDHAYVTQNGKVMRETIGTGTTAKVLDFVYDNSGKPFALTYTDGTAEPQRYYYVLNIQGDVIALMTADRTIVARYAYNAWGKLLSVTDEDGEAITSASHIANLNPIRYRGYYYDAETGFYYLQSRYYDPANHRFINADGYASTGQGFLGYNMFAYCNNSPAMFSDSTGCILSPAAMVRDGGTGGAIEIYWIHDTIQLLETNDKITIYAYLTISGTNSLYSEDVIDGIEDIWEGDYSINGRSKYVDVVIIEGTSEYGKSIDFIVSGIGVSNAVGPVNMANVPTVYLYKKIEIEGRPMRQSLGKVAAHEFGHCLGVEDYYTHVNDPGYDPDHQGIMTSLGHHATDEEIAMVIQAFYTGQYQYWREFVR